MSRQSLRLFDNHTAARALSASNKNWREFENKFKFFFFSFLNEFN